MKLNPNKPFRVKHLMLTLLSLLLLIPAMAQVIDMDFEVGGSDLIDDERRINILILSDGYTDTQAQKDLFLSRAQTLTTELFGGNSSPFDIYADYFNVYRIFVPSDDPGARHPCEGCSATTDTPEGDVNFTCQPYTGISTAFGSSYDTEDADGNGFHRLLCADATLVNAYIETGPLSNHITSPNVKYTVFVLVNTDGTPGLPGNYEWGGCGNMDDGIATLSGGYGGNQFYQLGVKVGSHEFGHTFALIQDEYFYDNDTEAPNKDEAISAAAVDIWEPWEGTGGVGTNI